jgi:hypothetical protein
MYEQTKATANFGGNFDGCLLTSSKLAFSFFLGSCFTIHFSDELARDNQDDDDDGQKTMKILRKHDTFNAKCNSSSFPTIYVPGWVSFSHFGMPRLSQ